MSVFNKIHLLTGSIVLILVFLALTAFKIKDEPKPNEAISSWFMQEIKNIENVSTAFSKLVQEKKNFSDPSITEVYSKQRQAFKRAELFLAYFDHEFYKKHLNGAPLLSIVPNMPELSIKEPEGLQVMDELIAGGEDFESFRKEAIKFNKHVHELKDNNKYELQDYQIFDAATKQVIRLVAMSITGFDTPGTRSGSQDAYTVLSSMQEIFAEYKIAVKNEEARNAYEKLTKLFTKSQFYLNNKATIDELDNYMLVRDLLNPLYGAIVNFQKSLGIENIEMAQPFKQAIDHDTESIFSSSFINPDYYVNSAANESIEGKAKLGKMLFFDPALSGNGERSCASCHKPELAFSDGETKSIAFNHEGSVNRNSPTLVNSIYASHFFYDLRAKRLEDQMEHVVLSPLEFNSSFELIRKRLSSSNEYKALFKQAFPDMKEDQLLSKYAISASISAYLKTLVSFNSKFDQAMNRTLSLSDDEIAGFNLFMTKGNCATCHFMPTFAGLVPPDFKDSETEVLGVPQDSSFTNPIVDTDKGRYASGNLKEQAPFYMFSFKTPTLRNVSLTAPYMHNGVYNSLEQVLQFYNKGGGAGMGIDLEHQTLGVDPLELSEKEIDQIVLFLKTLEDNPFKDDKPKKLPLINGVESREIGGVY